jgi:hypothetical protein
MPTRKRVGVNICFLQAAADLRGDVDEALFWFKNHPIRDFDRKTADRLCRGEG